MSRWIELEAQRYMPVAKRAPVVLVRGEGSRVWDEDGKAYLDLVGGWAVNTLGHSAPVIVDALTEQAATLIHTSNQFYTVPQLELADLLIENSPFDRVFFANSGVEANEGAVKLVRKYGQHKRNGAYTVITTDHSFHGRSLAMLTATGKEAYKQDYGPLPPGFVNVPFNDLDAIKQATNDETCAIMLEVVQGEGGVNVATKEYLQGVRDWCDRNNLVLVFDEVQTGVGRLGTLWGFQKFGVEPDVMTLAKGLGGGVPIGAFLAKEQYSVFTYGDHGSTFGGNPLATAVALAVMREVLKRDIPGHVEKVGTRLVQKLEELRKAHPSITDVRGMG
ncbi:MAG: aspartate aminotransferase family protein, partial [Chloroflexota bacterium]|nr:aspartate aminotransferase family protein [Chloroflexota bacterium]